MIRTRLVVILKTDHEVIRITHNNHIAAAAVLAPPLDPQVEHIVQVRTPRRCVPLAYLSLLGSLAAVLEISDYRIRLFCD
jgi:hypothetical protein